MAKITVSTILEKKKKKEKIVALTCYDAPTAKLLNEVGIDIVLVGDSVGMVKLGYENTLPVTIDEMFHHTKAVARGNTNSLLVADMPYLSYEVEIKDALNNAGRLVKEGGAEAVKLEGGLEVAGVIKTIINQIKIPVMGHLGMTPQSLLKFGGYKPQGKDEKSAEKILTDAKILEGSGVFAIVLECIPEDLAGEITEKVSIPTIGIGSGRYCDGQILVLDDIIGLYRGITPKFVKKYANIYDQIFKAVTDFKKDVIEGKYPSQEHTY